VRILTSKNSLPRDALFHLKKFGGSDIRYNWILQVRQELSKVNAEQLLVELDANNISRQLDSILQAHQQYYHNLDINMASKSAHIPSYYKDPNATSQPENCNESMSILHIFDCTGLIAGSSVLNSIGSGQIVSTLFPSDKNVLFYKSYYLHALNWLYTDILLINIYTVHFRCNNPTPLKLSCTHHYLEYVYMLFCNFLRGPRPNQINIIIIINKFV